MNMEEEQTQVLESRSLVDLLVDLAPTLKPRTKFRLLFDFFKERYYPRSMYTFNEDVIDHPYIRHFATLPPEDENGGPYTDYRAIEDAFTEIESPNEEESRKISSLRAVMQIYAETHR
jgi:hypothetical protein